MWDLPGVTFADHFWDPSTKLNIEIFILFPPSIILLNIIRLDSKTVNNFNSVNSFLDYRAEIYMNLISAHIFSLLPECPGSPKPESTVLLIL